MPLWPGSPECCPTFAFAAAAMLAVHLSPTPPLCLPQLCSPCSSRCSGCRYACRQVLW
ncbi:hypothetical protein PF005_g30169 [Phytophthora fragariae]|uniref:Uncharacterized protein n=1 Tax=Phytophthora fragariae TaxID=53985 RepID=A0A6A3VN23_9STRA|nr:hypothetical protein PF003_g34140 [Phytophthora fragariae]KAE8920578.1 hypothetical protein PF009_g29129 [Phytophthora fragariae]KAE9062477.1 hypothetical protein PF007_g29895 [Phytophthora fragariae]KAE9164101.1 hypothetical protein PF005_g30169 [Phytophthora fragariae]KAE9267946.1 hypothetical protein PF001_g29867 [Phytophthora fragariae]